MAIQLIIPVLSPLLAPRVITEINTEYGDSNGLPSVSFLSDKDLWTCGQDNKMKLYNLRGN